MRRLLRAAWGGGEQGITLLELLVALALFAIIAIGTLGALGATNAGGLLEGFPVAFATSRGAKDITAATVYVQGLQEHLAKLGGSLTPGTYTSSLSFGYPEPSSQPYQLNWTELEVIIEEWGWNSSTVQYEFTPGCSGDCLLRIYTKLTWQLRDATCPPPSTDPRCRKVEMERFVRP